MTMEVLKIKMTELSREIYDEDYPLALYGEPTFDRLAKKHVKQHIHPDVANDIVKTLLDKGLLKVKSEKEESTGDVEYTFYM